MCFEFMRVQFLAGKNHKKVHRNTAVLYLANLLFLLMLQIFHSLKEVKRN